MSTAATEPRVVTARPLLRTPAIAAAYALAGLLVSGLVLPPGHAAPVWPAAGVALVAAMAWGWTAVPGIVLGAFLARLYMSLLADEAPLGPEVLAAALVAVGAGAQAIFGAWLVRRYVGEGNPLESGASLPLFIALGGPVACLVSVLWGTGVLFAMGLVAGPAVAFHAATWWVGDTIGVLLCAPLLLASLASHRVWTLRRWAGLAVPLAVCFVGVIAMFVSSQRALRHHALHELEAHASVAASSFGGSVGRAEAYTESVARAFGALPEIDRAAFRALVSPWLQANAALEAIEWAPIVPGEHLAAFAAASRDPEFPEYAVRELAPDGRLVPAAARNYHAPLLFVEPLSRERGAVGYDLASSGARRAALEAARDSGRVVGTSAVRLLLYPGEWGALLIAASYGGMEPPRDLAERRAEVRGYVATVVRVDELVRVALERAQAPLGMRVVDVSATPAQVVSGPETIDPETLTWSSLQAFGGRTWRLDVFAPDPGLTSWVGWTILAAGLAGTGLVAAFVLDTSVRSLQIDRLVRERTAELALANDALTRSNLELQRFAYVASHDMREPLRTIACFTELLEQEAADRLDEAQRGWLRRVVGATRRMQDLVAELLSFARAEGRVEVFEPVPLAEPARAALDDLDVAMRQSGAVVTVGELPVARCDRVQVVQLFQNLLSNALKFRRPDVPPRIDIAGRRTPDGVEIAVRDNGIGIEEKHWERVFEMFQKLHPAASYPGHGIGLATCRRIVERHGGKIWVTSEPGAGSVFHFTLPAAS